MKISVIIPVKNGAQTLEKCLNKLRDQTVKDIEIIVLDSMSSDNSKEIALKYHAKIVEIPDGTFNHGLTRNLGVQHATGDLIYLTVQDAWIADNDMLEKMAKHFENKEVMGVVGHQAVPHEKDKNPLVWFNRFSEPIVRKEKVDNWFEFKQRPISQQQDVMAWDNVVSMYRKTALEQQPFVVTDFAEDWIWSEQALKRGWTLVHDPFIIVWHYHHIDYRYAFEVAYTVNFHFYKFFGFKPLTPQLLMPILKAGYHLSKHGELNVSEKIYWFKQNLASLAGTYFSHLNFLARLKTGGKGAVEKGYRLYCKKVPQGKLKK